MPINDEYINSSNPITETGSDTFSRTWFRFFSDVAKKTKILTGEYAGTAALPPTPAGYMIIVDADGVRRKVPYYE